MNNLTLFIEFDLSHQKMLFFLDWLDRSPLAVKQLFGVDFIHCYSSIDINAMLSCRISGRTEASC